MIDLWTLPLAENGEDTARSQTNSWRSENVQHVQWTNLVGTVGGALFPPEKR